MVWRNQNFSHSKTLSLFLVAEQRTHLRLLHKPAGLVTELRCGSSADGVFICWLCEQRSRHSRGRGDCLSYFHAPLVLRTHSINGKTCQGFLYVCVFLFLYETHIENPSAGQKDTKEPLCSNETQPYSPGSLITIGSGVLMSHTIELRWTLRLDFVFIVV